MSTMRIGGLASGMDIDSIVEKLMMVERMPLDKLEQKKQTYEWQRDAYRDINTKLQTLDTYIADNLVLKSLNSKTATSSNSEYVTATATGSAAGTLSIEGVFQLATAARGVGNQVNAIGSTTLADLFRSYSPTEPITDTFIEIRAIQKDGTLASTPTKIEFTQDMTVSQFVNKINSSTAGVSAVFENGKLSITAKNTGDVKGGQEIVIDSGANVFKAFGFADPTNIVKEEGTNAVFQVNGIVSERASNSFSLSGYTVTLNKTFNTSGSTDMVASYLEAAQIEQANAAIDLSNKTTNLDNAKTAYSATVINNYVTKYNSVFNNILNYDEQKTYSQINNSSFFLNLTDIEIAELQSITFTTADDDKTDKEIQDLITANTNLSPELKEKLGNFNKGQLLLLDTLNETQLAEFKKVAQFKDINNNSFFINLNDEEKTELASLNIGESDTHNDILDSIVSTTLKEKLNNFTKDQIVNTVANLDTFVEEADVEKLKSEYTTLSTAFLKDLSATDISNLAKIDFSLDNPLDGVDETLKKKIDVSKQNALKNLSDNLSEAERVTLLTDLKDLATVQYVHDEQKTALDQATNAYNASVQRKKNADATVQTAEAMVAAETANPTKLTTINSISLTSTTNIDDMVNRIKEFVTTYNGLIKDLNNLTKEDKYRNYQPLTTAQRKEMEESEIKLWEQKAKSGLLRGDSIIQTGLSSMRSLIYQSNSGVANEKYNTLFSIGITTSKNYLEGGTLEIDENKLRAALEEDPDAVSSLFSNSSGKVVKEGNVVVEDSRGYLQKLRTSFDEIQEKIENRAGRSTMTQTQYTLGKYLKDVDDQIEKWQDKLVDIENRYWSQFSAMETLINKANSQSTMLSSQYY